MFINGKERRSQYERIQDAVHRNDVAITEYVNSPEYKAWKAEIARKAWVEEQKRKNPTLYK